MRFTRVLPVALLAMAGLTMSAGLASMVGGSATAAVTVVPAATSSIGIVVPTCPIAAATPTPAPSTTPIILPTANPSPSPTGAVVARGQDVFLGATSLGLILTDSACMTLYAYTPDTAGASTCYTTCATNWPPLITVGDPIAGPGVDPALLGMTLRTDGTRQVTYNKIPLYHYIGDKAPGDVKGQGLGKIWYVVAADGTLIKPAA